MSLSCMLPIGDRRIAASKLIRDHLLVEKGIVMHQELELSRSIRSFAFAKVLSV